MIHVNIILRPFRQLFFLHMDLRIPVRNVKDQRQGRHTDQHAHESEQASACHHRNNNPEELAKLLDVTPMIYGRYESGTLAISEKVESAVRELAKDKSSDKAVAAVTDTVVARGNYVFKDHTGRRPV